MTTVITEQMIDDASPDELANMVRGLCESYRMLLASITAERKLYETHVQDLEQRLRNVQAIESHNKALVRGFQKLDAANMALASSNLDLRRKNRLLLSDSRKIKRRLAAEGGNKVNDTGENITERVDVVLL